MRSMTYCLNRASESHCTSPAELKPARSSYISPSPSNTFVGVNTFVEVFFQKHQMEKKINSMAFKRLVEEAPSSLSLSWL
ncbi:hypothetical protein Y1Q_0020120 [Alligator mississippiensis]|uniref:Uncharacterized protein n=1 Tax=Alligator mississippiensis TaxID=8496 RepID=A0A151LZ44_ALLMI|nr:hypothetical protein Y1Q_0020120 [Alligator mississippiensis]